MVSPDFLDRRRDAGVPSDSQAKSLHHRIAGVSPAGGCTQPLMSEIKISKAFGFALRQSAGEMPAIRRSVVRFKNDTQITQIKKIILEFYCF
jgi:hypothetical protein